jgi:hypothetical protein
MQLPVGVEYMLNPVSELSDLIYGKQKDSNVRFYLRVTWGHAFVM